ncbi:MAG: TonB-dependent receptor plug domain-containing protein [Chitinispirillaceae bacterium]|nr:TonB-dependent receptor plug domain-containing protein [Chitinispirillaceae bacterium]
MADLPLLFRTVIMVFSATALAGFSQTSYAENTSPAPSLSDMKGLSLNDLLTMKVTTASKSDEDLLTAPATVYVINSVEIERYGCRDLRDILELLPNFDNYWHGIKVDGSARGFQGILDQVTFLINGREFIENRTQQAWIMDHSLPAGMIERVEVVMGPMATLYGAHSMQGVINVVLKTEDPAQKNGGNLTASYAGGDRRFIQGLYRRHAENLDLGVSFSKYTSVNAFERYRSFNADDFFSRQPALDSIRYKGTLPVGDDQQVINAFASIGDAVSGYGQLYAGYNYWETQTLFGMDNPQYDHIGNQYNGYNKMPFAGWRKEVTRALSCKTEFQYQDDLVLVRYPVNDTINDATIWLQESYYTKGRRYTGTSQANWKPFNRLHLVAGLEYNRRIVGPAKIRDYFVVPLPDDTSDMSSPRVDMRSYSGFMQARFLPWKSLNLHYGLRIADESFATRTALHHAAAVYTPFSGTALKAIFSQGFRPPGFIEITNNPGQPAIDPMAMDNYELNYSQQCSLGSLQILNSASPYYMIETNRFVIERISGGANDFKITRNPDYSVRGFENMLRVSFGRVSGFASARWADPDSEYTVATKDTIHTDPSTQMAKKLKQVPAYRAKLGLAYSSGDHLTFSGWVNGMSRTKVAAPKQGGWEANGFEVYTVKPSVIAYLNIRAAGFKIGSGEIAASLFCENLFNTTYYWPYPSQGTRWTIIGAPRIIQAQIEFSFF